MYWRFVLIVWSHVLWFAAGVLCKVCCIGVYGFGFCDSCYLDLLF